MAFQKWCGSLNLTGADKATKRMSSISIYVSLSLSLSRSLDLSRPIRGKAEASRGGHGLEGGGADVDKIYLS